MKQQEKWQLSMKKRGLSIFCHSTAEDINLKDHYMSAKQRIVEKRSHEMAELMRKEVMILKITKMIEKRLFFEKFTAQEEVKAKKNELSIFL